MLLRTEAGLTASAWGSEDSATLGFYFGGKFFDRMLFFLQRFDVVAQVRNP